MEDESSDEGAKARAILARVAADEQPKSNEMIGAELGYRYLNSPIICDIPGGPEQSFRNYVPTTWPGARLPNVWLNDGRPVQDLTGPGYTILRLGNTDADLRGLEDELRSRGAPVILIEVTDQIARDVYDCDAILLRPDLHIVWRAQGAPLDPGRVADIATGYSHMAGMSDAAAA
jgi:hypothetical protein